MKRVLAVPLVAFCLGCGGGGGGSSSGGGTTPPPSGGGTGQPAAPQSTRVVITLFEKCAILTAQLGPKGYVGRARSRAALAAGCPKVTDNRASAADDPPDPWLITVDYGTGCTDALVGKTVSGRYTMTLTGPGLHGNATCLAPGATITFAFANLAVAGEALTGTVRFVAVSCWVLEASLDLTVTGGGVNEHLTLAGTYVYSETTGDFTLNATGTYTSPSAGSFSFTASNLALRYSAGSGGCEFPAGGILATPRGGTTETWTFTDRCGRPTVSINGGAPTTVTVGGSGGSSGTGPVRHAPTINSFSVDPATLPFQGGKVTYTVVASDADGDNLSVAVSAIAPDGSATNLGPKTGAGGAFTFSHTVYGNLSLTGKSDKHYGVARVSDGRFTTSASGADVVVLSPVAPPPTPTSP
ncbi:MAG: hypothetical protein COY42_02035 [Armatimonadetes bacterium CG_4_10_14_0_8_um_filter_66_14]|nr:hypothetical protein [Armatimonadota bacterium]OIP11275.1 MAG: hypothetical protein AUJ96_02670 [Armatimonadetes bacterium CG2_30_66_41]PIZ50233.1 MAG: hypothetical protein COY42_02035 [Armatimonadetes bacterium CG_4_10_14_0_8_um_filter_66_14]